MITDGVLQLNFSGNQKRRISCSDHEGLRLYIHHKFGIPSLELYKEYWAKEVTTRAESVAVTSSSKSRKLKVMKGFLVNCYETIKASIGNNPIEIKPESGTFTFVKDYESFLIPTDVTVVGIENHENFCDVHLQRHLFAGLKPLFVWRYQNSNSISDWMKSNCNHYLHFGDFDPKGIHIYVSEFRNKIGKERCRFFVPSNLTELFVSSGRSRLFEDQEKFHSFIKEECSQELEHVIGLILKFRKGVEQEILIPLKAN